MSRPHPIVVGLAAALGAYVAQSPELQALASAFLYEAPRAMRRHASPTPRLIAPPKRRQKDKKPSIREDVKVNHSKGDVIDMVQNPNGTWETPE